MGYRDDLEAALEQAESLERELAHAKSQHDRDEQRIAELEKKLKAARTQSTPPTGTKASRGSLVAIVILLLVAVAGGVFLFLQTGSTPTPATPATPATPRPPSVPKPPPPPKGAFDVSASYNDAVALAQPQLGEVQLLRIEAAYIDEQGLAELGYGGEVRYRFVSLARVNQPPPAAPVLGAPAVDNRLPCRTSVWADKDHQLRVRSSADGVGSDCQGAMPGPPRCTLAAVWQKALAKGAPANALATVDYRLRKGQPSWRFYILDQATSSTAFDEYLPDDCP